MKAPYSIWFALAVCVAGCTEKEELPECPGSCTVVTGRLLTSGSAPLSNAVVTLQWAGGPAYSPKVRKKAIATTDANGRYRVSGFLSDDELADGFIEVVFSPDKSKYYLIGEPELAFYQPKRDTVYSAPDFLIPRKGSINFVVTNPSQIPTSYSYYVDFSSCYGGNTVFSRNIMGGGASINLSGLPTPYIIDAPADQRILVRQRKNGSYIAFGDTIFVPSGTTQTYTLTY
ncbi:carboxypeptidase-like regulatory domain-containing protein [Hymenobacter sp. DH14]|uniref:Carboxypeptidase-like regulatory domain-containing protein n=1 Tax=Hymenobacter cyanobacteriorum TaxID=2926463 RepID=A0A9X1VL03_9BACT|nr:carboxypeptidase-like regulatory domain-containing protein [Hymenobacter cyanobacteriorum]MCI1188960.1 carboxypeptidase-like regulatory domain-containing protein [Hymenobacter cyanobacteriorum]